MEKMTDTHVTFQMIVDQWAQLISDNERVVIVHPRVYPGLRRGIRQARKIICLLRKYAAFGKEET